MAYLRWAHLAAEQADVRSELGRVAGQCPTGLSDGFGAQAWRERMDALRRREAELASLVG